MITTVTCERCGKKFTAHSSRRFCADCQRRKNNEATIRRNRNRKREQARARGADWTDLSSETQNYDGGGA